MEENKNKPLSSKAEFTEVEYKSIKHWRDDDKPREKMQKKGKESLSDGELLAILIGSGTPKRSAIDLAREILEMAQNDLNNLSRFTLSDFQKVKGIGIAKAVSLAAALELGRRRQISDVKKKDKILSSKAAASLLVPLLQDKAHEVFCVMYLNNASRLIHHEFISSGGVTATIVDIKMILKNAINYLATTIIVAHNHPSGNLTPSKSDIDLTEKIKNAAQTVDLKLVDHIIVAEDKYYSFADEGMM